MIKKEKVYLYFYYIALFFTVFDGLRHNIVYNEYVTYLKEVSVFLIFLMILIDNDGQINISEFYSLIPFFLTIVLAFPIVVYYSNIPDRFLHFQNDFLRPYIVFYRCLQVFLLFVIYNYFEKKTGESYQVLLRGFIYLSLGYVFFTVLFYLIKFPFIIDFHPYWGRISSGYPTMDAQVLIGALITNFMVVKWKKEYKRILFSSILLFGILIQATGTGIATLGVFLILYFLFNFFLKNKSNKKCIQGARQSNIRTILIGGVIITLIFSYVIINYYQQVATVVELFQSKLNSLLGNVSEAKTVQVRFNEFSTAFGIYNSPFNWLFGGGTLLGYQIEGQFGFLLRSFGIPSLIAFLFFIFYNIIRAFKNSLKHEIYLYLLFTMMLLVTTSTTLLYSYLFAVQSTIALMFNYFLLYRNRIKKKRTYKIILK